MNVDATNTGLRDIVDACKAKDQHAYKKVYDRYAPRLYAICLRYMRSRVLAEEVLHDAFLKIFDNIYQLRSVDSFEAWMCKLTVNTAIDALVKESPIEKDLVYVETYDDDKIADDSAYDKFSVEEILDAIAQLPDLYRAAFNMREIEGYDFDEIAERLDISEGYARYLLTRAKRLLKDSLQKTYRLDNCHEQQPMTENNNKK